MQVGVGAKSDDAKSRDWANQCRRNQARWQAHNTGKTWVLDIVNRTTGHKFKVHQNGKNLWQAGLRYYKGLDHSVPSWVWTCTKIVSGELPQPSDKPHKKVLTS
tara:strand:+ start:718 stop:1029 length:312 start_codon:yes stop_codon:yes gene_type:complete